MNNDYDNNLLFDLYSNSFGITAKFDDYCLENTISNHQALSEEFRTIQESIFTYIWDMTHPDTQLNGDEIYAVSEKFCNEKYPWMNTVGIIALNRWLAWMCWHEGILKI